MDSVDSRGQRILILSGTSRRQYPTLLNHRIYADLHGYRYRFDVTPHKGITNLYFHKLVSIMDALEDCDWLFWLDDDAAFTQMAVSLESIVPELDQSPYTYAIFCKSPINRGKWTYLSIGNFFVKNCARSRELLTACIATDLAVVKDWWQEERFGMLTNGDQDALVYCIETQPYLKEGVLILNYERFNTRPFHYRSADQHFLVHFTHSPDRPKLTQMREFASQFGLNEFLVTDDLSDAYASYLADLRL